MISEERCIEIIKIFTTTHLLVNSVDAGSLNQRCRLARIKHARHVALPALQPRLQLRDLVLHLLRE